MAVVFCASFDISCLLVCCLLVVAYSVLGVVCLSCAVSRLLCVACKVLSIVCCVLSVSRCLLSVA